MKPGNADVWIHGYHIYRCSYNHAYKVYVKMTSFNYVACYEY